MTFRNYNFIVVSNELNWNQTATKASSSRTQLVCGLPSRTNNPRLPHKLLKRSLARPPECRSTFTSIFVSATCNRSTFFRCTNRPQILACCFGSRVCQWCDGLEYFVIQRTLSLPWLEYCYHTTMRMFVVLWLAALAKSTLNTSTPKIGFNQVLWLNAVDS